MKTVRLLHNKIHMPTVSDVLAGDDQLDMNFFYNKMNRIFDYPVNRKNIFNISQDEIIEVDVSELLALPTKMQRILVDRKLMVTSAIDIHRAVAKLDGLLGGWRDNVVYVTSNHSESSQHCETFYINPWPLFVMNTNETGLDMLENPGDWKCHIKSPSSQWCLFPNLKARPPRVILLAELDRQGLLSNTTWSLGADHTGKHTQMIKFDVEYPASCEKFIQRHSAQLPKFLDIPSEQYSDGVFLDAKWVGAFDHTIAAETRFDQLFLTEKTYRGFALGATNWVFGHKHAHQRLRDEGFEMPPIFLSGDVTTDAEHLVDCMKSHQLTNQQKIHNFEIITNIDWLKAQILDGYHAAIRKLRIYNI